MRIVGGDERHCPDRTGIDALAATVARFLRHLRNIVRGVDRMQHAEPALRDHRLAAAAAAVADEADLPLDILTELHKVSIVGLFKQSTAFSGGDAPGESVFRQGGRSEVERHADLHRSIARTPQVLHLMPAVAHPYADVRRRVDHMRGALVVEDVQTVLRRQGGLLHIRPPRMCHPITEELLDKILLDVQILIEKLSEEFLVDVAAEAHHREFEEARHGGRKAIRSVDIKKDGPGCQFIKNALRIGDGCLPAAGGLFHVERLDGKPGDETRLMFAEEELQDMVQHFRRGSALRKPIEAFDEVCVSGSERMMGHREYGCQEWR